MRRGFIGLVAFGLLWGVAGARANPEREALRRRLAADQVKVRFLENEEASILAGLEALERGIREKEAASAQITEALDGIERQIRSLTERIVANQERLRGLRDRFGKRAAAMLRLKRARLTRLLRRISDPNEVRRTRDRFDFVKAYDLDLIRGMLDATAADRRLREDLAAEKEALVETKAELDVKVEEELDLRAERQALLTAIRKERVAARRLARELRSAARRLDAYVGKVMGQQPAPEPAEGGFAAQRGRLPWPVTGRVEVPFGKKVDPDSGMVLLSRGLDIRADLSAPVRAVFPGRVVYAASRAGFGRLAIVDHGGFYTLYAHLESFAVRAGDPVAAQQVLGHVGDSGSTKGAYLYFEIRQGRDPVDPIRWLAP